MCIQYSILVSDSLILLQVVTLGSRPPLSLLAYELQNLSLSTVSQWEKERMWKTVSWRFCLTRPQPDILHFISIHILLTRKQSYGSWWLGKRAKKSKKSVWRAANSLPVLCLAAQVCSTLCDCMDYSLSGSSDHGILQTRILEWIAIPFSRRSSQSRDQTQVSHIAGGLFTVWATSEAYEFWSR